jgi:hypothetical protein
MSAVFRALSGDPLYWSLVSRAATAPAVSPAEDALFPASDLQLADPMKPFRFGSWDAASTITVDLAQNDDGGLETWTGGVPDGFAKSGAGTLTQVDAGTGQVHSDTYAAKLETIVAPSLICRLSKDFTVRAGEYFHLDFWWWGDGTNAPNWRAQNLTTNLAWNGSTWVDPTGGADRNALAITAAWDHLSTDIPIESYQACGCNDTVTLRVSWESPGVVGGIVYVDDIYGWALVDVAALYGHTFTAHALSLHGSTDNFAASDVTLGTVPIASPASYLLLGSRQNYRYYRLVGTARTVITTPNPSAPFVGPFVLGQTQAFTSTPHVDWDVPHRMMQVRNETRGRAIRAHNLGRWPVRDPHLTFTLTSQTILDELRYDLVQRSGYGLYPMLVIPHDGQAYVHWCRATDELQVGQTFATSAGARFEATLALQGEGCFTPAA